jgi:hypothetical protein
VRLLQSEPGAVAETVILTERRASSKLTRKTSQATGKAAHLLTILTPFEGETYTSIGN